MPYFTFAPIKKLFKKAGAKRVSDKAAEELIKIMEDETKKLLMQSKRLSEHAGRRTVMKEDVKSAKKMLK